MEIINFTDYENPIFCDAFKKYFKEIEVEVNDWDKLFKEINNNDKDCSKVIIESNQMIGFLMFRIDEMKHWFFDEKIGFLREFWIDPNYRNQGLGTKLLKAFEEKCKDTNRIILTPDEDAIHFYEKNGYHFEQINAKNKMDVMVKIIEHPHYKAIQLNENHVDFVDEIYKEHIDVLHGNPISIDEWKEYLCGTNNPDESNYIITCNDENVGWLKVNGLLDNKVFISMLVVSQKNQHQGVGSYAIRFAEQLADNKEIKEIYVQTTKDNQLAIQCYLKNGFEIEKEINIPLRDGNTYQGYVFKKKIN